MSMVWPSPARQKLYTTAVGYLTALRDLVLSRVHRGDDVAALEAELASRLGVPHVIAVNQCRIGLYLAVKAVLTADRRRVVMSPFTIYDVVNMVVCAGARPVFADIVPGSCTLDPVEVEALLDDETAAVIIMHTHARCADYERMVEACRRRGVVVIEDAAVVYGTTRDGRAVGTTGDIGVYSFGLFKNVSAIYGGAVVTHDERLSRLMRDEERTFGRIKRAPLLARLRYSLMIDIATNPVVFRLFTYWLFRFGYLHGIEAINKRTRNDPLPILRSTLPEVMRVRMSPLQARLIRSQLKLVRQNLVKRVELAKLYYEGLCDIPGITMSKPGVDGEDSFLVYPIQVGERSALLRHLMLMGRDCASYYYRNCSDLECFAEYRRECPRAHAATEQIVLMPTYTGYGKREAAKNIAVVRSYCSAGRRVSSPNPTRLNQA